MKDYRGTCLTRHYIRADAVATVVEMELMFTTETIPGEDLLCDPLQSSVEETALYAVMCCKLYMCLDKLPPEERELVNRIYFLGYSLRQLSAETGVPYMTIQHRKVKILAKLKKLMES